MNGQQEKHHIYTFLNATETALTERLYLVEDYNATDGFTVADYCTSAFSSFHPQAVRMVTRNDDYYLGCRANHFVLIFGQSEVFNNGYTWADCVVCLANHKGGLCVNVFRFIDDLEIREVQPHA